MKKPLALLALSAVLLLAGCNDQMVNNSQTPIPKTAAVTSDENGKTVTVAVGGTITATLASNPSTGYQWTLQPLADTRIVQFASSEYKGSTSTAMGAGGTAIFTFQALAQGITPVRLVYARSFAPQDNPHYFTFTVVVKPQVKGG